VSLSPQWNGTRRGWYEAYFFLVNDPERGLAVWLRWLLLVPRNPRAPATTSLWGMVTRDNGRAAPWVVCETFPVSAWQATDAAVSVGQASLGMEGTQGQLGHAVLQWQCDWKAPGTTQRLFPGAWLYAAPLPKTKVTAPAPDLEVWGELTIAGERIRVAKSPGYIGHLWGTAMAEEWAWAQCNNFDGAKAECEMLSAVIRMAGCTTPPLSLVRMTIGGEVWRFTSPLRWARQKTRWETTAWDLTATQGQRRLRGTLIVPEPSVLGLTYQAPDASRRYCYHSDLTTLELHLEEQERGGWHARHHLHSATARYEAVSRRPDPRFPLFV
jgi:hypothetical protein